MKFMRAEVASLEKSSQKRGIDTQLSGCFKKLIEKAEDSRRRCGACVPVEVCLSRNA
jgi:hypothetical protein